MSTQSYFANHSRHPRRSLIAHLVAGTLLAPLVASAQQAPAVQEQAKQEAAKPAQAPVQAQAAQATVAPPAQTPVESTVTVSAVRTQNRIDRQSYDVKADPATSNDSVADTLNKVPSVAVDADGNVTLRGRNNVQILVDGKPSAMMQGENRASALAALPASDLESVEVINNPGAQFGNEGGGGPVINLVMRRERSPGGVGGVNANVGTEGRYNTGAFGSWTQGRYSLQGGVFHRVNKNESSGERRRERIDPVTGAISPSLRSSTDEVRREDTGANARLVYNLGDKDVIGVTANYSQTLSDGDSAERYRSSNAAGIVDNEYLLTSTSGGKNRNYGLGGSLEHKGDAPGEKFQMDLRMSGSDNDSGSAGRFDYTVRPRGPSALADRRANDNQTRIVDFTGDYELPGEHGVMKIGYKVARNSSVWDNAYFDVDPLTGNERVNTSRTNRFELTDMTYALYGSYQWRVNEKWGVLGGLRAEYADLDMNQATTGQRASNHYFDAIPSAFVTYGLSDDTTLRLSYAHRIRRPGAGDLNPFVIYRDEQNISSGNPNLQPTNSDSLELGIETKLGKVNTNVRLYARRDSDLISERRFLLANDVLLTTRENAGSSRSGGLEFNFSGNATQQLSLNVSGNIGYFEQTVLGSVNDDKRNATSISGRAFINYQMDAANSFRLMLNGQGKTLFGEGYREPSYTANLNYSRKLTPALTLNVNINDLFDSQKTETITETDRFREYSIRRNNGRMAYIGLNYRFGSFAGPGGQRRPMMFGGPGGPGGPGPGGVMVGPGR
ncbi:outer membrane beta-barrel family protein [Massilia sp. BSC265]|uniref:outer membrane beta-barrel family protein n=1 Tax=Massilia sp. BSC265 TaxID=1549812 RepID=UPI0004E8A3AE|nr:outer membrane beta-barrel family protein [Massilia sp. BSC265]KFI07426.1 TonB-dependent receptor [Massilia sp. BSC265]